MRLLERSVVPSARKIGAVLLSLQLAVGPHLLANAQDGTATSEYTLPADLADSPIAPMLMESIEDPRVREQLRQYEDYATAIERGELINLSPRDYDTFHLRGQRLEIMGEWVPDPLSPLEEAARRVGGSSAPPVAEQAPPEDTWVARRTFSLSEYNAILPVVPFTNITVETNQENRELIINAMNSGRVTARQVISDIDVVAVAWDREMVHLIDSRGNLSLMDMAYIGLQGFNSPIPIYEKVYEAREGFTFNGTPKIAYLTRGLQPFEELRDLPEGIVVPRDHRGNLMLRAGDAVVYTEGNDGARELVGIFSRETAYRHIHRGTQTLQWLSFIVSPASTPPEILDNIGNFLQGDQALRDAYFSRNTLIPEVRNAVAALKPEQVRELAARGSANLGRAGANRDFFPLEEWMADYTRLHQAAEAEVARIEERGHSFLDRMLHPQRVLDQQAQTANLRAEAEAGNLHSSWLDLIEGHEGYARSLRDKPYDQYTNTDQDARPRRTRIMSTTGMRMLAALAAGVSVTTIYATNVIGYINVPGMGRVNIDVPVLTALINRIHNEYFPAVLKVQEWHMPQLFHGTSLLMIIPITILMAMLSVPFMKLAATVVPSERLSAWLHDQARVWGQLNTWQKLVSAGMRVFAQVMLPFFNYVAKGVGQHRFIDALKLGINPARRVEPNSELGRAARLEETVRPGLNVPRWGSAAEATTDAQSRLQSAVAMQRMRSRTLAWTLATVVVAERENIDPATLTMVGMGELPPEEIRDLLNDPEKRTRWERTAEAIYSTLRDEQSFHRYLNEIDAAELARFHRIAVQVAEDVAGRSEARNRLGDLRVRFRNFSIAARYGVFDFGRRDYEFLRSVYANDFVSQQVRKEYLTDNTLTILIPMIYGPRADVNKPGELGFLPGPPHSVEGNIWNLWTNPEKMYGLGYNTMLHFFQAGARTALVFQGRPEAEDNRYVPIERVTLRSAPREERTLASMFYYLRDLANVDKADIGGTVMKFFTKRFTTIQASFLMSVGARMVLADSNFEESARGFALFFLSSIYWFGWPWFLTQTGNNLEEARYKTQNERFTRCKEMISQGLRSDNMEQLREGYRELVSLYEGPGRAREIREGLRSMLVMTQIATELEGAENKERAIEEMFGPRSLEFMGALTRLSGALARGDNAQIDLARREVIAIYTHNTNLSEAELLRLNAQSLVEFSVTSPPIATHKNWKTSWGMVVWAAASTTIWAISLEIAGFEADYLSNENLLLSVGKLLGFVASTWLLLSKSALDFYRSIPDRVNDYMRRREESREVRDNLARERARERRELEIVRPVSGTPGVPPIRDLEREPGRLVRGAAYIGQWWVDATDSLTTARMDLEFFIPDGRRTDLIALYEGMPERTERQEEFLGRLRENTTFTGAEFTLMKADYQKKNPGLFEMIAGDFNQMLTGKRNPQTPAQEAAEAARRFAELARGEGLGSVSWVETAEAVQPRNGGFFGRCNTLYLAN